MKPLMKCEPKLEPCRYCGAPAEITEIITCAEYQEITIKCCNCGITLNHTQRFIMKQTNKPMTGELIYVRAGVYNHSAVEIWNGALMDREEAP